MISSKMIESELFNCNNASEKNNLEKIKRKIDECITKLLSGLFKTEFKEKLKDNKSGFKNNRKEKVKITEISSYLYRNTSMFKEEIKIYLNSLGIK